MTTVEEAVRILKSEFLKRHGELRYSEEHGFIGHERSRDETHVTVGYSYNYFNDAKTTRSQYLIPIQEWDNPTIFPTFNQYTKQKLAHQYEWFYGIVFDLSLNTWVMEETPRNHGKELKHLMNPPYKTSDRSGNIYFDDDDFIDID